jgi:hypothetical protein
MLETKFQTHTEPQAKILIFKFFDSNHYATVGDFHGNLPQVTQTGIQETTR